MATKKNLYTGADLDFLELQVASYREWLEKNPYNDIVDRKEMQLNKKTGGSFMATVQVKEAIQKAHRDTTREMFQFLEILEKLRAADEQKKKTARGGGDIPEGMEDS